MKDGIHPNYQPTTIRCACGAVYETRSTKQNISIEICSKCHPFYTGKQKLVDTSGRVDKFNISIIFSGGVYVGENTARLANVRIGRLWCTMRALQRAAISSTEDPAKRSSVERVPQAHAKTPLQKQRGFDLCDLRNAQTIRLSRT